MAKNKKDFGELCEFIQQMRAYNLERKKWVGKLCWFWDGKTNKKEKFSILTSFDYCSEYPYRDSVATFWQHCEPISPDDDIIFK